MVGFLLLLLIILMITVVFIFCIPICKWLSNGMTNHGILFSNLTPLTRIILQIIWKPISVQRMVLLLSFNFLTFENWKDVVNRVIKMNAIINRKSTFVNIIWLQNNSQLISTLCVRTINVTLSLKKLLNYLWWYIMNSELDFHIIFLYFSY